MYFETEEGEVIQKEFLFALESEVTAIWEMRKI